MNEYDIPSIPKGSLVVLQYLSDDELSRARIGDVLAYDWDGQVVVHRVIDIDESSRTFILKGDANNSSETVYFDDVVGQVIGVYPTAGKVLSILKGTPFLILFGIFIGAIAVSAVRDILRILKEEGE